MAGTDNKKQISSVVLQVKANIDGASTFTVKNSKIYWRHWQYAAPGLHLCDHSSPEGCTYSPKKGCEMTQEKYQDEPTCHLPTIVTAKVKYTGGGKETMKKKWYPIWPYEADDQRYHCRGCKSSKLNLKEEFGIDLGTYPELSFWGYGEGRDCDDTICDGLTYYHPSGVKWEGKCCNSRVVGNGEIIELNFYDESIGSADYEFSLGLKPRHIDEDEGRDDEEDFEGDYGFDAKDHCRGTRPDDIKNLKSSRYQLAWNGKFEGSPSAEKQYNIYDTGGCSCKQILKVLGKDGGKESKYGCKLDTMIQWIERLRYVEREKMLVSDRSPSRSAPCMGLKDDRVTSGVGLKMVKCNAYKASQCWNFKYRKTGDKFFRIHPCSDKELCVGGSGSRGDALKLEPCSSKKNGQYFNYDRGNDFVRAMENKNLCIKPGVKGSLVKLEKCSSGDDNSWDLKSYQGYDAVQQSRDPVIKYDFNTGSSSSRKTKEGMGTGFDMKLHGAIISSSYGSGSSLHDFLGTDCRSGSSLRLKSKNGDYGEVLDNSRFRLRSFTISVWFRYDGENAEDDTSTLLSKANTNDDANGYWLRLMEYGKKLSLVIASGSEGDEEEVDATIPKPRRIAWHHAVATYDGRIASLYIDGGLGAEKELSLKIAYGNESFLVGKMTDRQMYFTGYIDDIMIWNYALAADDVQRLFESGSCGVHS